jgi:hypothetical protein
VFGYILVHAPIKWHIQIETSLDVLASSLIDHTPSDTEMLGSIEEITFKGIPIEDAKQLLPSLQKSVIKLVYLTLPMPTSTILTYDYSFLTNLQSVGLNILMKQENYRLYQALRTIQQLTELDLFISPEVDITLEEFQALSDLITCSCTLKSISLNHHGSSLQQWSSMAEFSVQELIQVVLSSSTVTAFTTNIVFVTNIVPKKLESINILSNISTTRVRLLNCLCCAAMMCREPSMKHLKCISPPVFDVPAELLRDFFTLLNASLHCNPAMKMVDVGFIQHTTTSISTLSRAFSQDPDTLQQNLKRSTSLCDLTLVKFRYFPHHHQSCPDLSELQSLHTMHPLLCKQYLSPSQY